MHGGTEGSPWLPSTITLDSWGTWGGAQEPRSFSSPQGTPDNEARPLTPQCEQAKQYFKASLLPFVFSAEVPCCGQDSPLLSYCRHSHQGPGLCSPLQNGVFPNSLTQAPPAGKERDEVRCGLRVRVRLALALQDSTRAPRGGQSHPT